MSDNTKNNSNSTGTPKEESFRSEFDRLRKQKPDYLAELKSVNPAAYDRLVNEHLNPVMDFSKNPDWDFRDWQKKDPKGLHAMYLQNPTRYNELKNAYGK